MREPDFELDGWCLDDGEEYQRASPDTFWIPDSHEREGLQPGDHAKLIFRISADDENEPVAVERMWVLVRERIDGGCLGVLNNDPYAVAQNDGLWSGVELPFFGPSCDRYSRMQRENHCLDRTNTEDALASNVIAGLCLQRSRKRSQRA